MRREAAVCLDFAERNMLASLREIKGMCFGRHSNIFGLVNRRLAPLGPCSAFYCKRLQCFMLLFFIISGFYMSMVLNAKYLHSPVVKFYIARTLTYLPDISYNPCY